MIRVQIAATGPALRTGLTALLSEEPDFKIAAAGDAAPDVLIAVRASGLGAARLSEQPVLWLVNAVEEIPAGFSSAALGILPLEAGMEEIAAVLRSLAEGLSAGSPALLQAFYARPLAASQEVFAGAELTPREMEVLTLLAEGLASKQIAERLQISIHTVKFHIGAIYARLGASSRADAVRIAYQYGWLSL